MKKPLPMRDVFFTKLYERALVDKNIVLVSVDLGAPSLDVFRENLPEQFFNIGICEQNAILVATGFALTGKRVFVYGITEFITFRCFEQIKLYVCGAKLPITILGIGQGASFSCDGMTHHALEQLSVLRTLPNLNIYNCSANDVVDACFDKVFESDCGTVVFFEKDIVENLWPYRDLRKGVGFSSFHTENARVIIVTTGVMVSEVYEKTKDMEGVGIIDVYKFPVDVVYFIEEIKGASKIVTLEENCQCGGLGSMVLELLNDAGVAKPVKRFALDTSNGYHASYLYPNRRNIRCGYGLKMEEVLSELRGKDI